jgi:16S rRNA G966 N2-methylase RsmD
MFSSAQQLTVPLESVSPLIPDSPIESTIPYRSRQMGASRHFGFFPFFAKKPWPVVQEYIKHYTHPGDLVCDPFAGSGVTPVEALVLGRRALAGDINPVARFITRMTAIAPVDLAALQDAYRQVQRDAQDQIESLDEQSDTEIGGLLDVLDYPQDPIPRTVRRAGLETINQLHTPRQLVGLALLRDAVERVQDPISRDLLRVALANTVRYCNITYILPYDKGKRRSPYRGDAQFLRRFSYSPASSKLFYENRVWPTFELRFRAVLNAKDETNHLIDGRFNVETFVLTDAPASRIHEVAGEAMVDYCFTDPPYSNDIHFLDLSTLWAGWLRLEITEDARAAELLLRGKQLAPREQFAKQFAAAVDSIARALKPERWLTLVYKHRDLSLWHTVVSSCEDSGLSFVNAVWQDLNIRSTRQIESPNINPNGDMYLNFRKLPPQRFTEIYGARSPLQLPTQVNYVEHEIERLIVSYLGADIALLTAGVLQQVLNSGNFRDDQDMLEGLKGDIGEVVNGSSRFTTWQPDGDKPLWVLAANASIDLTIDPIDRARYLVFDFLREQGEATEGEIRRHLLTRLAESHHIDAANIDVVALLRNVGTEVTRHRWRFDANKLLGYKQLRLLFRPSQADNLRHRIEQRRLNASDQPLQADLEGIALLRDRLKSANSGNAMFATQYGRLVEVLQAVLRRVETEFGDQVERVMAVGEWAKYGIDLRGLPFDDVVLLVVVRRPERPFELYMQIADRVFTNLSDEDILVQFRLETVAEWQQAKEAAQAHGINEALGIPLLVRA